MSDYLIQYRDAIRRGEIRAGNDMIQELDKLIADLDDPLYKYDTRDAEIRITFIEGCIRLTKSPFFGKPMLLMLWQKALIEVVYSFKIRSLDTGEFVDRFQEILLLIPRKNGKTELVAALELTEMLLGRPGSDIVCSGMDDGTADLAYQAINTMRLLIDPKSVDTWKNQFGMTCFVNKNHIYKLSASTRQREGRNIDIAGLDEVWSLPEDGDIYKSIQQSTSTKDRFKIFMFSSEGFVDGFLNRKRAEYQKIVDGEDDSDSARRKLPWMYTQDSEREVWETDADGISKNWQKSNPTIGVIKKWSYMHDRVDEARKSKSDRLFVLSKDFNFKQNHAVCWLNTEDYLYPAVFDPETFRGAVCLGAVDLSETTDLTSAKIMLLRKNDPHRFIMQHYWIPAGKLENADDKASGAKYQEWARAGLLTVCDGNDNDLTLVADWFYQLYQQYGIMLYRCGYDQKFAKEFLRQMENYGFDCEMVLQNKQTLSNALNYCEQEFKAKLINFNENPIDIWNLGNAALEMDKSGFVQLVKIPGQPGRKIDGAVSLIILYEIFRRYRSEILKLAK